MLDERKMQILYAIIENYTLTAEPVGSKTILNKYDLGVSSATIRNDMSFLEEIGLLEKTHTSSGRIPSNKAYRFYVDRMLENIEDQSSTEGNIEKLIGDGVREINELISRSTKILSDITKHTALAVIANDADGIIKRIYASKIEKNVFLVVIVFDTKDIVHEILLSHVDLGEGDVSIINKLLNQGITSIRLSGLIEKTEEYRNADCKYTEFFDELSSILQDILNKREKTEVLFEGLSNIFQYPEYRDTEKAKDFIDFIEDSTAIKSLLAKDKDKGLSVNIGEENSREDLNDITVISSSYGLFGNYGRIGIIGPTRMDYDSVIFTILSISNSLKNSK